MKLHIISDIHLEFSAYVVPIVALESDVIILAGDIGVGIKGIQWAQDLLNTTDAHVIYLLGNHEAYHHDINEVRKALRDFCNPTNSVTKEETEQRLHFLDNDQVIINGVRFLGGTCWTDFRIFGDELQQKCMQEGERYLNDFRIIRNGERMFSAQDSIDMHNVFFDWLKLKLDEPFDGKTVVITHHCPSWKSVAPRYKKDLSTACFSSNLEHLMDGNTVQLWMHGHTHDSYDYMVKGTRVVCNPRGYCRNDRNENDAFNPELIINLVADWK